MRYCQGNDCTTTVIGSRELCTKCDDSATSTIHGLESEPIDAFSVRPDMHNKLRVDAGMDKAEHCADCWAVMDGGVCPECGTNEVYDYE